MTLEGEVYPHQKRSHDARVSKVNNRDCVSFEPEYV